MSTLVLKLVNIDIVRQGADTLTEQKRTLIKSGLILFAIILITYLYLVGGVVGDSAKLKKMDQIQKKEMRILEAAENKILSENKNLNITYFLEQGYEEPRSFGVIKRKPDVAKNTTLSFY